MSPSPDVVIIGGGIVGLCAALAAADRDLTVVVIDDAQPGAASRASAGMLGPSLPGLPASVRPLALAARDFYPDFVAMFEERSGTAIALDRSGILEVAASRADLDVLHSRGDAAERLDQRELGELEPALGHHVGALLHPLDGWVDNRALMDALHASATRDGRITVLANRVTSMAFESGGARVTLANRMEIATRRVVLATGAWGNVSGVPALVRVRPVKGELLTLEHCPVGHVVYGASGYAIPRGRTLLVGATSEEGNFDPGPSSRGRQSLLRTATTLVPVAESSRVLDHWGALRPVSPDGLPMLGADRNQPALLHASGFSRNGILLAPWAGRTLAALAAGELAVDLPAEFRPSRFDERDNRSS